MTKTKRELQQAAKEILSELQRKHSGIEEIFRIHFKISSRLTSTAGKAMVRAGSMTGEIVLSLPILGKESNFDKGFRNTVTHEIAHVLSPSTRNSQGRRSIHGRQWKEMHKLLGGSSARCHDMSELAEGFSKRTRKARVSVECGCGCGKPMRLGPTQLKRHQGGERYRLAGHSAYKIRPSDPINIFDL